MWLGLFSWMKTGEGDDASRGRDLRKWNLRPWFPLGWKLWKKLYKLWKIVTFCCVIRIWRNKMHWNRLDVYFAMKLDWKRSESVKILSEIKRLFNFIQNKTLQITIRKSRWDFSHSKWKWNFQLFIDWFDCYWMWY